MARLQRVRTLRELGTGLSAFREVVERKTPLPEVAAAHAEALAVQLRVTAHCARLSGGADDDGLRQRLPARVDSAKDPRRERYRQLLAVINGRPVPAPSASALDWSGRALRARTPA
ncbi:hypothetical protein EES39_27410 [Streptomyces sp. ADI92-24]|nr:hypothetical protein EES39_27410 [Streptomyces sp. ADI92-24]